MDELPDYMQILFLALYNSIHEMAYDILREKNQNVLGPLSRTVFFCSISIFNFLSKQLVVKYICFAKICQHMF